MSVPATVYIALGATVAAIIAGWVSTTTIIVAKDQKISEFRQKWIEDLRDSVSALIGNYTMLSGAVHFHSSVEKDRSHEERLQDIAEEISKYCPELLLRFSKIRLMLNIDDDTDALEKLQQLENTLQGIAGNFKDPKKLEPLLIDFETSVQTLLKKEWERVKAGEPNYQTYKRNTELFPVILFIILILSILILQFVKA